MSLRTIVTVRSRSTKIVILAPLWSKSSTRRSNGRASDFWASQGDVVRVEPGVLSELADWRLLRPQETSVGSHAAGAASTQAPRASRRGIGAPRWLVNREGSPCPRHH